MTSNGKKQPLKAFVLYCPVKNACLEHALSVPEMYGVWGGLSADERIEILKFRGADVTAEDLDIFSTLT